MRLPAYNHRPRMLYLAEFQNISRHVRVCVVSVAMSQKGSLLQKGGAAVEEEEGK